MAGFTSRDDIITELTTNGKRDEWNFVKTVPNTPVVGTIDSIWAGVGNPGAGSNPATTPGTAYDSDTASIVAGSIFFADRSPDLRFLISLGAVSTQTGTLILYDRLVGVSGAAITSTGAKTINSTALTRYTATAAVNNECWWEMTTAITTNSLTMNLSSYTSSDGSNTLAGGTVVTTTANGTIGKMIPLPLNASEAGVRSVETLTVGGTAPAAGAGNLLIIKRLAAIPIIANIWNEVSFLDDTLGLPRVFDNATLGLAWQSTSTTAPTISGIVRCAYG